MKLTQGARLAAILQRSPATYGEMQGWHISTSPQKRIAEWLDLPANKDWMLFTHKRLDGLVEWRIVRRPKGVE